MIACTAVLVFFLLFFAPFRIRVFVQIVPKQLKARIKARAYCFRVFDEVLVLYGTKLLCDGTVDTELDLAQVDGKNGIDLIRCITFERFCVSVQNNLPDTSIYAILFENVLASLVTKLACEFKRCKIYTEVIGCFGDSNLKAQIDMSFNVAELSICLLKQGVKLWMRKSVK